MLFTCMYGATDLKTSPLTVMANNNTISNYFANHGKFELEKQFSSWGKGKCEHFSDSSNFLVDIPNKLIFNIMMEENVPKIPTIYVDYFRKKLYVCNKVADIFEKHNGAWARVHHNKEKFFEWDTDEEVQEQHFLYEVPDEDYDDIYKVLEPYITYDFERKINKVINSFPEIRGYKNYVISGLVSSLQDIETQKEFRINTDIEFWKFLVFDLFNMNFISDYEKRFPRKIDILRTHMGRFHSHYLETGNNDYDPTIEK
ncbi:hypothetical protein XaC1_101 [Xanthomonas phage XaC1]|nr:hypothetical protein XaC1_101 [Xanthomonas phage XaC1]